MRPSTEPGCRAESASPGRHGRSTAVADVERGRRRAPGSALCCIECGRVITDEHARVEVGGAHRHTFFNPHGLVFEIGCFGEAPGAVGVGPSEAFFSWFPGYAWRVGRCRRCEAHLGWSYGARPDFFGLILDRLGAVDDEPAPP